MSPKGDVARRERTSRLTLALNARLSAEVIDFAIAESYLKMLDLIPWPVTICLMRLFKPILVVVLSVFIVGFLVIFFRKPSIKSDNPQVIKRETDDRFAPPNKSVQSRPAVIDLE